MQSARGRRQRFDNGNETRDLAPTIVIGMFISCCYRWDKGKELFL